MRVGDPEHVVAELFGELRSLEDVWSGDLRCEADSERNSCHGRPPAETAAGAPRSATRGATSVANRSIDRSQIAGSDQSVAPITMLPKPSTAAYSSRILRATVSGLPTSQTLSQR